MSLEAMNSYSLGQTAVADELPHLLGQTARFTDTDLGSGDAVKPLLSQRKITAIWVKNASGVALLPAEGVKWATAAVGQHVDVKTPAADPEDAAGIVDPYLPAAGVANGRHHWLIVDGPTDIISDGVAALSAGDAIAPSNTVDGNFEAFLATSTTNDVGAVGRMLDAVAATPGLKGRALVHFSF